jgi:hypothetical protein
VVQRGFGRSWVWHLRLRPRPSTRSATVESGTAGSAKGLDRGLAPHVSHVQALPADRVRERCGHLVWQGHAVSARGGRPHRGAAAVGSVAARRASSRERGRHRSIATHVEILVQTAPFVFRMPADRAARSLRMSPLPKPRPRLTTTAATPHRPSHSPRVSHTAPL